jgi:hypothetical protein
VQPARGEQQKDERQCQQPAQHQLSKGGAPCGPGQVGSVPAVGREADTGHEADGEEEPSNSVVRLVAGDERPDDREGGDRRQDQHIGSDTLATVRLSDQGADHESQGDRGERRRERGCGARVHCLILRGMSEVAVAGGRAKWSMRGVLSHVARAVRSAVAALMP